MWMLLSPDSRYTSTPWNTWGAETHTWLRKQMAPELWSWGTSNHRTKRMLILPEVLCVIANSRHVTLNETAAQTQAPVKLKTFHWKWLLQHGSSAILHCSIPGVLLDFLLKKLRWKNNIIDEWRYSSIKGALDFCLMWKIAVISWFFYWSIELQENIGIAKWFTYFPLTHLLRFRLLARTSPAYTVGSLPCIFGLLPQIKKKELPI